MSISKADGHSFSWCPLEAIAIATEEEEMKRKSESCLFWMNSISIPLIKVKASGIDCIVCDLAWHGAKSYTWLDFSMALIMTHMRHAIEILCFQFHPAASKLTRMCSCSCAIFFPFLFFFFFLLLTSAPHTISRGIRWYLWQRIGLTGQHVMTAWS